MIKAYPLTISSIRVFEIFRDEPQVFFLDSSQKNADRGRYSFIGFAPFDIYRAKDIHSLEALQKKFNRYKNTISKTTKTPLPAGIVGFISYDYGVRQENILRRSSVRNNETPDVYFGFYDTVITVDHYEKRLVISSTGLPAKDIKRQKERARKKIAYIEQKLKAGVSRHSPYEYAGVFQNRFKSSFSKNAYLSAVNKALVYIAKGDIYQVNLSQQFEYDVAGFPVDKVKVYKKLRDLSPSSFSAYLDAGAQTVMSSSPERFLKLEGRKVQTRPMKGTRPRGINKKQDARYLKEIKESPKEKAELLMITDLLRNDLGRVCEYGTVSVKTMRTIEKYKTVYQATSTVEGMLRKDHDAFDLLEACLPGGSITGCPKIRSMQIIEEVEPVRRGIYTGVMGYINFNGDMDFNVLIRTLLYDQEKILFHVGSGIVADSHPEAEYVETLVKAKAIQDCLKETFNQPVGPQYTIFYDGQYVKKHEAFINTLTPGIVRAPGVFETIGVRSGQPVALPLHFERLHHGLKLYKISSPFTDSKFEIIMNTIIRRNHIKNGRLRLAVWKDKKIHAAVIARPVGRIGKKGYAALISSVVRPKTKYSHVKSMDYFLFRRALQEAKSRGYDEAILLNRNGQLVEGSTTNLFFVKNGVLFTPSTRCGCLSGIVRQIILDCARTHNIPVQTGAYSIKDLQKADEAFITNSLIGVKPLVSVDGHGIGKASAGAVTAKLRRAYHHYINKNL